MTRRSQPCLRISSATRNGRLELALARDRNAGCPAALVVVEASRAPDLLDQSAALGRELDDLGGVAVGAVRQAIDQELRDPKPLMHVELGPEQQRRVCRSNSHFSTLSGADGLAHGSAWLTETCPPLAKLVSSPAAGWRSMTQTLLPARSQPIGRVDADDAGAEHDDIESR